MKIIFHFGAHKTASTHLQYNLALNREYLNKLGTAYFRFQEIEGLQKRADFLAANVLEKSDELETCIKEIKDLIEKEINGYQTAIISYEGCLGYHNHLKHTDIYPNAKYIIPIYQDILKNHEVLPVYAIRDYNEFMDSTYRQELAHGMMNETIDTYFSNKKITRHRWTVIMELLHNQFSQEIKVFTFEDYKTKWMEITLAIIGLANEHVDYHLIDLEANKKNDSVSKIDLWFNYTLNRLFLRIPNFKYKQAMYYRTIKHIRPIFRNNAGRRVLRKYQKDELPVLVPHLDYMHEEEKLLKEYSLNSSQ